MPTLKIICISGVDGVGKTSVINGLKKKLILENKAHDVIWIRFINYLSKILLFVTRLTGHNKKEIIRDHKIGVHIFYNNNYISYSFLLLQFFDQIIFIVFNYYFLKKQIIITDRGIQDTIIDWIIDTHKIKFSIYLGNLLLKIMPKSYCFLLIRKNDEIIKNKPDVLLDKNFYLREKLYRRLFANLYYKKIINTNINESINIIYEKIN